MPITERTRKMLWGRSGGRCSICRRELFEDESLTDNPSVLGQECHIVGEKPNGPRGEHELPLDQRDYFDNLLLLCLDHHKIIDDQRDTYTVEALHRIKNDHLIWVKQTLSFDERKQADEEVYISFAETFARLARIDNWDDFTFGIMSGDAPILSKQRSDNFDELHDWLFGRIYPNRYLQLNDAFENFRKVLHDFRGVFSDHIDPDWGMGNLLRVQKFYRIDRHDEQLYNRLLAEYRDYVWLLEDLALELTRASNYVCDMVRAHVMPSYRLKEGLLVAKSGIGLDGKERDFRPQYKCSERSAQPYPGLVEFKEHVRFQRDVFFGEQVLSEADIPEGE